MVLASRRDVLRGLASVSCLATGAALTRQAAVAGEIRQANGAGRAKGVDSYPIAVAVGPKGTIFVADKGLKIIYRVENGNLVAMYRGSRKYRTPLFNVMAMAVDSSGNLFLCDTGSMDVWRVTPDGKPTPLTGKKIARGIGPAPTDQEFDRDAAYAGKFDKPMGIVIDPEGNPVVADLGMAAIFGIPAEGGEPRQIASVPAPHGIALDRQGGFVVVSQSKDQLVRISAAGEVTPIVKGRIADKNNPHHVAVDAVGYVVTDNYAKAVWRISTDGVAKAIVQGDPLVGPVGLAIEADGNFLVADPHAKKIFRVTPAGKITEVVALPGEGQAA